MTLQICIGDKYHRVASFEEASRLYLKLRDEARGRYDTWPAAQVFDARHQRVAHVGFNGRVWAGPITEWRPGKTPLFDPLPKTPSIWEITGEPSSE